MANFTNVTINCFTFKDEVINLAPGMYYSIGVLMILLMIAGFSTNSVILFTYATNRKTRTVDNSLIIGLSLSDIGQAILGIPFVAVSSFSKKWIFGHVLCQYYVFITTAFGIAQICLLTVIAVERYFVIVRRDRRLTNTPCRCAIVILFAFIYGSSWATGPLVGWSGYKEEEIGIACCVKWEIKDSNALSYTLSLCIFGWLIPLFLIAFGYINIVATIYEGKRRLRSRRKQAHKKANRERKVAFTVLIMIGAFFMSWTPYSVVSMWSAVGNFHSIPLWVQVAPAIFAKCSIIWNPMIYVARHQNFRHEIKESMIKLIFQKRDLNPGNYVRTKSSIKETNNYRRIKQTDQPGNFTEEQYIKDQLTFRYKSLNVLKSESSEKLSSCGTSMNSSDPTQIITNTSNNDETEKSINDICKSTTVTQKEHIDVHAPFELLDDNSNTCIQNARSSPIDKKFDLTSEEERQTQYSTHSKYTEREIFRNENCHIDEEYKPKEIPIIQVISVDQSVTNDGIENVYKGKQCIDLLENKHPITTITVNKETKDRQFCYMPKRYMYRKTSDRILRSIKMHHDTGSNISDHRERPVFMENRNVAKNQLETNTNTDYPTVRSTISERQVDTKQFEVEDMHRINNRGKRATDSGRQLRQSVMSITNPKDTNLRTTMENHGKYSIYKFNRHTALFQSQTVSVPSKHMIRLTNV